MMCSSLYLALELSFVREAWLGRHGGRGWQIHREHFGSKCGAGNTKAQDVSEGTAVCVMTYFKHASQLSLVVVSFGHGAQLPDKCVHHSFFFTLPRGSCLPPSLRLSFAALTTL